MAKRPVPAPQSTTVSKTLSPPNRSSIASTNHCGVKVMPLARRVTASLAI
jgi:hypothetical protein